MPMALLQHVTRTLIGPTQIRVLTVQMQNDGGVTVDPGTAGNLWNLARSAAQLYGRRLQEHTETE